jgi:hypothetical protein
MRRQQTNLLGKVLVAGACLFIAFAVGWISGYQMPPRTYRKATPLEATALTDDAAENLAKSLFEIRGLQYERWSGSRSPDDRRDIKPKPQIEQVGEGRYTMLLLTDDQEELKKNVYGILMLNVYFTNRGMECELIIPK